MVKEYFEKEFITNFREVDQAFLDLFKGIMIGDKEVPVTYYSPDTDILDKRERPKIAVYRTTPMLDMARWTNDREFIDSPIYDENGKLQSVSTREFPEPMIIEYQVRIIYEMNGQGEVINSALARRIRRGSFITIKGYNYSVEKTFGGVWGSQYKNFGQVKDGERKFEERLSYKVFIWYEVGERTSAKTVKDIVINVGIKENSNKEG